MDNYLVTGGLGFIGTNYVKELIKKENKVIILDSIEYAGNPDNFKGYKIYCKDNKKIFNLGEYTVKRIKRWEKRIRLEKIDIEKKLRDFYRCEERLLIIKGNLLDSELINLITDDIDYIVHFAAETHVDRSLLFPERFIFSDIIGSFVLYNTIKEKMCQAPFLLTPQAYPCSPCGFFKPFKFICKLKRILEIGKTIPLLDELCIKTEPISKVHVG